jgi:putative membrane protein
MSKLSKILIAVVALEHLLFLVMEMFLWQNPAVMARFGTTPEFAAQSAALAMNQGLYNGFLSAGLGWALLTKDAERARSTARFFLGCVIVAGGVRRLDGQGVDHRHSGGASAARLRDHGLRRVARANGAR